MSSMRRSMRRRLGVAEAAVLRPPHGQEKTYWNGKPTPCARVRVVVGPAPSGWWCARLVGTEREAVRVECDGQKFYLDNENGSGWGKVTGGMGSPQWGHSSLPVEREIQSTPIPRVRSKK